MLQNFTEKLIAQQASLEEVNCYLSLMICSSSSNTYLVHSIGPGRTIWRISLFVSKLNIEFVSLESKIIIIMKIMHLYIKL